MKNKNWNEKGEQVMDNTPVVVPIDIKEPLSIEQQVKKQILRQQYFQNMQSMSEKMNLGNDIDDEYESDEAAFTAAETEYKNSQVAFQEKRTKFFKAAQEKQASEEALKTAKYKEKVAEEAKKLGLLVPKEPKASESAQVKKDE